TVAFLGACGEQAAEAAFEIAPKWPTASLDVTLGAVEPMGNPRRPNAFAAIVRDRDDVLRDAILAVRDEMCERAGARIEVRAPKPHVTIARPRRSAKGPTLRAAIGWARSLPIGEPRVSLTRLVLYGHSVDRTVRLFREHAVRELGST